MRFQPAIAVLALTVLLAAQVVAQESRESRPASRGTADSRAASLRDLVEAGRTVVDLLKGEGSWGAADRLRQEGFALLKGGRDDEALTCFERLGKEFPQTRTSSMMLVVHVHVKHENFDAAVEFVENFLAGSAEDEDARNFGYLTLAGLHERRGDWTKALEAAEKSKPLDEGWDFYGEVARQLRIARCRFHLGEIDAALKLLEEALAKGQVARFWASVMSEVATTYAEYSGRSGRLLSAQKFAATLPPERRTLVLDSIKVVEAWLSKQPAVVMKVVAQLTLDDEQIRAAARLLIGLGPDAVGLLARGIETADVTAIRLAGASGRRELLAPLDKRYAAAGPDMDAVVTAIQNLESVESRPASRPAK
jgi:tetratricopeptide (TPR) repeat protein